MARATPKYDVALSYASENASFVRRVNRRLRARDRATFFAPEQAGHLWGKDEREFERIYGPGSRYVVPFVSEHYVRKAWTRLEFRAARREAKQRKGELILPVRLDSTPLPGLPEKLQYLDANRFSPEQVADLLIEKLGASSASPPLRTPARAPAPRVLSGEERDQLGLLATAAIPLPVTQIRELFPRGRWEAHVPRWRRLGFLVRDSGGGLRLESRLNRQLLADKDAVKRWRQAWVDRLSALREHPDTALLLSLQLLALRRAPEAVDVLIPIATTLEPGTWSRVYLSIFGRLASTRHIRGAQPRRRAQFLNAYGALLEGAGEFAAALAQFSKLRALSRRTGDAWGEGQSYINAGVAAAEAGNASAARAWYRRAVVFGKRRRDDFLAGRALGNLAQLVDPAEADALLSESERLKTRAGDVEGLVGTALAQGNLAAARGRFVEAAKHFRHAVSLARRLDLRHACALALRNLGRTEIDRGRPGLAYGHFQRSARICRDEGFNVDHAHALAGEAIARMEAHEYARAGRLFDSLVTLHRRNGATKAAAIALRDAGVAHVLRRRYPEAHQRFSEALRTFRRARASEWIRRTSVDVAGATADVRSALRLLRSTRRAAIAAQDFETAQRATDLLLESSIRHGDLAGAVSILDGALRSFPVAHRLPFLSDRFTLLLDLRDDRRITFAFHRLVAAARSADDRRRIVDAHMAMGDYLWAKSTENARANAYQAYVIGMVDAIQVDIVAFERVTSHVLGRLYAIAKRDNGNVLAHLASTTGRWLQKSVPRQPATLTGIALWPLRAVRRIYELPEHGKRASAGALRQILIAELRVAQSAGVLDSLTPWVNT